MAIPSVDLHFIVYFNRVGRLCTVWHWPGKGEAWVVAAGIISFSSLPSRYITRSINCVDPYVPSAQNTIALEDFGMWQYCVRAISSFSSLKASSVSVHLWLNCRAEFNQQVGSGIRRSSVCVDRRICHCCLRLRWRMEKDGGRSAQAYGSYVLGVMSMTIALLGPKIAIMVFRVQHKAVRN